MTVIFALFFLLLGFIFGLLFTCHCTFNMLESSAKTQSPIIGKYQITLVGKQPEQE